MSNRSEARALARTALTLTVCGLAAFVLFSTGPTAATFAQTSSPSATGSPTGTPDSYSIQFLNPSRFSEEISTRDEGGGSEPAGYHLVAWVNAVPANVRVEFKYRPNGRTEETLIGEGTAVAPGDTFELNWDDIPDDIGEGEETFRLYAVLYSGTTELARDTEDDLFMNDVSPPEDDEEQGSTVEITYPLNGGDFGIFERQDRPTQAVIDSVHSVGSNESTEIETSFFYTISRPGTEPTWTSCGAEGVDSSEEAQSRCSLVASHELEQVTAVAAIATDLTCDFVITGACVGDDDSGDAHRVLPYEQDPTTLTVTPDVLNEVATGACTGDLVVALTDQKDRQIANAPIDIHAIGPTDNLRFDDTGESASSARTSPAQPPSQGHRREEAENCEAAPPRTSVNEPAGCVACTHVGTFQGEHDNPTDSDLKHLESALGGGTGDTGTFQFELFSPDRGVTQYTVFVDNENEDDQFCTDELSVSGSVGWAIPADSPDGPDPEITSCPEPTPSPMASRTPTATPSESPTDDPRGCTIVGTDESEALEGTSGADVICAGDGNDLIQGLEGNDTIYGDGGADEIRGGSGNDYAEGGEGKDTIRLAGGNDQGLGGTQNDILTGGGGFDRLAGNDGFDTIRGGGSPDTLNGGSGDDTIRGGAARDTLFGKGGRDILHGDAGRDRCRGGAGRDRLRSC